MDSSSRRAQEEADAAFARSLQAEMDAGAGQQQMQLLQQRFPPRVPALATPPAADQRFTIRSGERAPVRLHHPATRNHIGEVFYANYITPTEIKFELVNASGKCLRVKDDGSVDFSEAAHASDNSVRFRFEVEGSNLYIMCAAHFDKRNIDGGNSWYLALKRDGSLVGNCSRCPLSQWVLVAADDVPAPPVPPAAGTPFPYGAPRNAAPQTQQQQQQQPASSTGGLGLGSLFGFGSGSTTDTSGGYNSLPTSGDGDAVNPLLAAQPQQGSQALPTHQGPPPQPRPQSQQQQQQQQQQQHVPRLPAWQQPSAGYGPTRDPGGYPGSYGRTAAPPAAARPLLCQSPDEQLVWLSTAAGQAYLSALPSREAQSLLAAGTLRPHLYRPDWAFACDRGGGVVDFSVSAASYDAAAAVAACPPKSQRQFFEDGFTVLRGVVDVEAVSRVSRLASFWACAHAGAGGAEGRVRPLQHGPGSGTGPRVELAGAVCKDGDVLGIYYRSALKDVAQLLIGRGEVTAPLGGGAIQLYYPSLEPPGSVRPDRIALAGGECGDEWQIEGFTELGGHSPFTLLIAVPLTSMEQPHCGNLCPHPASHVFLQDAVKSQVASSSSSFSQSGLFAAAPAAVTSYTEVFPNIALSLPLSSSRCLGNSGKPDLGPAAPLLLRRGDAVLCTQKCALTYHSNCQEDAAKMLFFRLSQVDHDAGMKDVALDFLWCEWRGVDCLEKDPPPVPPDGGGSMLDFFTAPAAPAAPAAPVAVQANPPLPPAWVAGGTFVPTGERETRRL